MLDPVQGPEHIPHPLAIVTAGDPSKPGERGGMAAAWLSRVSWKPPMVAVSIHPSRHTLELVRRFGAFAVNLVSRRLEEATMRVFGELSGREADKFSVAGITPRPARRIVAPVISEAPVVLECNLVKTVEVGDHVLVIGEVVEAYKNSDEEPMVWLRGETRRLLEERR
ncbi:MAG: flavin reductase family protein [Fervidicoccaceae archaeon]